MDDGSRSPSHTWRMPTDVLGDVRDIARSADDAISLQRQVVSLLSGAVAFDRWCGLVLDPATLFATGGYHHEGLPEALIPRLLELEAGGEDVNLMPALADTASGVSTIDRVTRGATATSGRYRDVLEPAGLGRELRAVLRDRTSAWGALILLRDTKSSDFSDDELALMSRCSDIVARGIRRCLLLSELSHRDAVDVPGMALISINGDRVEVELATAAARNWLKGVEDGVLGETGLPVAAASLALRARAEPTSSASTRLRARDGNWLTLHAELLESGPPARISLVIEPTRPHELAEVIAAAYGLTERERDIARLVVAGQSNKEVAATLWLSPWTVQDHLKNIFAKLGVHSRAELGARMFFDQYLPRVMTAEPLGADGWFIPTT